MSAEEGDAVRGGRNMEGQPWTWLAFRRSLCGCRPGQCRHNEPYNDIPRPKRVFPALTGSQNRNMFVGLFACRYPDANRARDSLRQRNAAARLRSTGHRGTVNARQYGQSLRRPEMRAPGPAPTDQASSLRVRLLRSRATVRHRRAGWGRTMGRRFRRPAGANQI